MSKFSKYCKRAKNKFQRELEQVAQDEIDDTLDRQRELEDWDYEMQFGLIGGSDYEEPYYEDYEEPYYDYDYEDRSYYEDYWYDYDDYEYTRKRQAQFAGLAPGSQIKHKTYHYHYLFTENGEWVCIEDGRVYQESSLPKGEYEIVLERQHRFQVKRG